jgi:quercetin 2,3-dioxygenase
MNDSVTSRKRVRTVLPHRFTEEIPGLHAVNLSAASLGIEPILVFTEFHMDRPIFGPHPHAGISVMTYLHPDSAGSFLNRDSLGDHSEIPPGGVHITQAGRGVHHDEMPLETGVSAHGFQIWFNHRAADRYVAPLAMHANAHEVPEVVDAGGKARVLHGHYAGQAAPYRMVTDVTLLHVDLAPGATIALPAHRMAFAYGLRGAIVSDAQLLLAQSFMAFDDHGTHCEFVAGEQGGEFMFASAAPLDEPIVYGGPFVMTTPAQMRETQQRYARGEMGRLDALPP